MKITFWGCRGSIPVSGKKYEKYGGCTTCVEVELSDGKRLILDSGTGIIELGNKSINQKGNKYNLFITHSHWDHIMGFAFFKPIYDEKSHIKIHVPSKIVPRFVKAFNDLMAPNYHPTRFDMLPAKIEFIGMGEKSFRFGKAKIETIRNNHHGICHGYKITEGKKSFAFLTDNELCSRTALTQFEEFTEFVNEVDLLVHDAMYLCKEMKIKRGWGHSCCSEVAKLATEGKVKKLGLFHHDPDRSDRDVDKIVEKVDFMTDNKIKVFAASQMKQVTV